MTREEKIEEEILKKQQEIERLRTRLNPTTFPTDIIKDLSVFTVEEKCKKFDSFYNSAIDTIKRVIKEEYLSEDEDHYAFDEIMNIVARDDKNDEFWKWFSGLYDI